MISKKTINHYLRVKDIQDIYMKEKVHYGITDAWIYEVHIEPLYHIDYVTFRKYLGMNVKAKLSTIFKK